MKNAANDVLKILGVVGKTEMERREEKRAHKRAVNPKQLLTRSKTKQSHSPAACRKKTARRSR